MVPEISDRDNILFNCKALENSVGEVITSSEQKLLSLSRAGVLVFKYPVIYNQRKITCHSPHNYKREAFK